jgi:hypothetical protein
MPVSPTRKTCKSFKNNSAINRKIVYIHRCFYLLQNRGRYSQLTNITPCIHRLTDECIRGGQHFYLFCTSVLDLPVRAQCFTSKPFPHAPHLLPTSHPTTVALSPARPRRRLASPAPPTRPCAVCPITGLAPTTPNRHRPAPRPPPSFPSPAWP